MHPVHTTLPLDLEATSRALGTHTFNYWLPGKTSRLTTCSRDTKLALSMKHCGTTTLTKNKGQRVIHTEVMDDLIFKTNVTSSQPPLRSKGSFLFYSPVHVDHQLRLPLPCKCYSYMPIGTTETYKLEEVYTCWFPMMGNRIISNPHMGHHAVWK